jgi:magnesium-transporting ATPase (P-type)
MISSCWSKATVPADAVLLYDGLLTDESVLTGESVPVRKSPEARLL